MTSEYILLTLTFEVYLAIVHPVIHKNLITTKLLVIVAVIIFLGSTTFHFSYNMATSEVILGKCYISRNWPSPQVKSFFVCVNFTIKYFIPLVIFAFCYIGMALSLKRNKVGLHKCIIMYKFEATEHNYVNLRL